MSPCTKLLCSYSQLGVDNVEYSVVGVKRDGMIARRHGNWSFCLRTRESLAMGLIFFQQAREICWFYMGKLLEKMQIKENRNLGEN